MTAPVFTLEGEMLPDQVPALREALIRNRDACTVVINSPGGDASAGLAICAAFQQHGRVTARIDGIAFSAASLAVMGARSILMHSAAMLMIHDPAVDGTGGRGTAEDHARIAEALEKMAGSYARVYADATGHPVRRIREWMRAETWMTADEALQLRFCDEILDPAEPMRAVASFDPARFRNPPAALVRMMTETGGAALPPDFQAEE